MSEGFDSILKKDSKKEDEEEFDGKIYKYLLILLVASAVLFVAAFIFFIVNDIPSVVALKDLKNKPVTSVYDVHDELTYLFVPTTESSLPTSGSPSMSGPPFWRRRTPIFSNTGASTRWAYCGRSSRTWRMAGWPREAAPSPSRSSSLSSSVPRRAEQEDTRGHPGIQTGELPEQERDPQPYLNNIYMGHGVYGWRRRPRCTRKACLERNAAEAALLAGIVQAPSRYTPKKHPGNARMRQEYVIDQMAEKKFITEKAKQQMLKEKVDIREDDVSLPTVTTRTTYSVMWKPATGRGFSPGKG
jgi:penicillin-binding protein 1A